MPRACHDGKRKVEVDGRDRILFSGIKSFVFDHTQPSIQSVAISLLHQGLPVFAGKAHWSGNRKESQKMKKLLLSIAVAAAAPFAWAQVSETTTTTTTTEGGGTITEFTPGSAIVLKETSGPRRYRFGKTVTYVTKSGKTLDEDTVKTKIRVGVPVHVHYVGTGDDMMVDRIILDED
jgi:hypothetical protein